MNFRHVDSRNVSVIGRQTEEQGYGGVGGKRTIWGASDWKRGNLPRFQIAVPVAVAEIEGIACQPRKHR
eukprot:2119652-Rhodomonas_salina.1